MPDNDFLPFATNPSANVESQASYEVDPVTATGVTAGTASSAKANKAWRQGTFVASCIAKFMSDHANVDVLDNGSQSGFITILEDALKIYIETAVTHQKVLTATLNLYVGGAGASDLNDGLTAGTPWATLQKAVLAIYTYNANGHQIIVNCTGSFSAGMVAAGPFPGIIGAFGAVFKFASGSSITCATGNCIQASDGASFGVSGAVTLSASSTAPAEGSAVFANGGSEIFLDDFYGSGIIFGTCAASHITAVASSIIVINTNYAIGGNAPSHFQSTLAGAIALSTDALNYTVTLNGTRAFSNFFAVAYDLGTITSPSGRVTYTGSATGTRYGVASNGLIQTLGGGANYFPGNAAGSASTQGLYL